MDLWSGVLEGERASVSRGPCPAGPRLPYAALSPASRRGRRSHAAQDLFDAFLSPHPDAGARQLAGQEVCFSHL